MEYWDLVAAICDQVSIYDGPEVFLNGFNASPRRARNLLAAHWCVSEVTNGGFTQFFSNSTGVLAPEAADAFSEIGLAELSRLVREAIAYFGPSYPRDRSKRQDILEVLVSNSDLRRGPFGVLDGKFDDLLSLDSGGWEVCANAYAAASN